MTLAHIYNPHVKEVLSLPYPLEGGEIMDLVRKAHIPQTNYNQEKLSAPGRVFVVGRRGQNVRGKDLAICVGPELNQLGIDERELYSRIAVVDHLWNGGLVPPLHVLQGSIREFITVFRGLL